MNEKTDKSTRVSRRTLIVLQMIVNHDYHKQEMKQLSHVLLLQYYI